MIHSKIETVFIIQKIISQSPMTAENGAHRLKEYSFFLIFFQNEK
jgi:hypothetical protein